jgi:hypothetical protein
MPVREVPHAVAGRLLLLILSVGMSTSPLAAKSRPAAGLDAGYLSALATVDRFLQAWQSNDVESGMVLLSGHAKETATSDGVERFFSDAGPSAYEVEPGKLLKRGHYEFPVVLVTASSKNIPPRRHFCSVVVVNTGDNDWVVDKLP